MTAFARIGTLLDGAWALAVLANVLDAHGEVSESSGRVLAAAGLAVQVEDGWQLTDELQRTLHSGLGSAIHPVSQLRQVAEAAAGADGWDRFTDEVLLAQGRLAAVGGRLLVTDVAERLPGLADRLARPGAQALDVGVGVAETACAMAHARPDLVVTGLDVLDRALELANATVARHGVADRVLLRHQDVATLDDVETFDLVWLPIPFIPEPSVVAAVPRIFEALRPGGWLVAAAVRDTDDRLAAAVRDWRIVRAGGTPWTVDQLRARMSEAGYREMTVLDLHAMAPLLLAGQRPGKDIA